MNLKDLKEKIDHILAENPDHGNLDVVLWTDHGQTQMSAQDIGLEECEENEGDSVIELFAG